MTPTEIPDEIERVGSSSGGVPHLVDPHDGSVLLSAWTRSLPLLVGAAVLLGFNALDLRNWSVAENLAAAAAIVVILVATWATVEPSARQVAVRTTDARSDRPSSPYCSSGRRCRRSCSASTRTPSRRSCSAWPAGARCTSGRRTASARCCDGGCAGPRDSSTVWARSSHERFRCCCCSPRSCSSTPKCGRWRARSTVGRSSSWSSCSSCSARGS